MDIQSLLAERITDMTGVPAMCTGAMASIDTGTGHFVIGIDSWWQTIEQIMESGWYSYEQHGAELQLVRTAIGVRVVYTTQSSGEQWRSETVKQTKENSKLLTQLFRIPIIGGEFYQGDILDRVENVIGEFDNVPALHGQGFPVYLDSDSKSDKFEVYTNLATGEESGWIIEQHFSGFVFCYDSVEVINR